MADSFYDQWAADKAASSTPQGANDTFYDTWAKQQAEQQAQALRASLNQAAGVNPDEAARAKQLATANGLPFDTVERNLDEVERRYRVQENLKLMAQSPILRRQMMDPTFAKLAHDDTPNLSMLETLGNAAEWTAKYLTSYPQQGQQTLARSATAALYNSGEMLAGANRMAAEFMAGAVQPAVGTILPENPFARWGAAAARAGRSMAASAKEAGNTWNPDSVAAQILGGGLDSGVQSLLQNTAVGAGALWLLGPEVGIPATLITMALGQGGASYQKGREQGLAPLQAGMYATEDAAAEYAFEKVAGLGGFLKNVMQGAGVKKLLTYELFREVPGEMATTLVQNFNEWANLNPDKTLTDFLREQPAAIAQTVVATLVGGGGQVAISRGLQQILDNAYGHDWRVQQAEQGVQHIEQIFKAALASKTLERDPDTLAAFMQQVNGSNVYVDGRVLEQVLNNEQGQLLLQQVPEIAQQLPEAVALGKTVEIPLAKLTAYVPGTALEQPLLQNLRITEDALSAEEAKQASQKADEFLQSQAQRVIDQAADTVATQVSADNVKRLYLDQLNAANRFTADVNEAYASLMRNFYTVLGGTLSMTPEQAQQAYPYRVVAQGLETDGQVLNSIGNKLGAAIQSDFEGHVKAYSALKETNGGQVLNTDLARELSPEYRADRSRAAEVHEASSAFIKRLYADKLSKPTPAGKAPYVLFTAGGTGAGKSFALNNLLPGVADSAEIVYDGTMSKFQQAVDRIEQALKAGREVRFAYIYRDPAEALRNGALPRAMHSGRTAPVSVLQESHAGARKVIEQLVAKYAGDERVQFTVIDNSLGKGNAAVVALDKVPQVDENGLAEKLNEILESEYQAGRISEAVYRGTKNAPSAERGGAGQGSGGQPEQAGRQGLGEEQGLAEEARDQRRLRQAVDLALVSQGDTLQQSATIRAGKETLKKYGLKPGGKYKTREVAAALEARQRAKYGLIESTDRSPEAIKKIAKWMTEEVMFEMQNPEKSGVGWYSEKFQRALDIMAQTFPELATDKTARNTMTALIAITSDGQKVVPNFMQAMDIYGNFRSSGKFTTSRGHARQASIDANMQVLQRLYDSKSAEEVHRYLMQERTISELKKIAREHGGEFQSDYQAHITMPMAAVEFGPKLGAFYANLMGAHGYLTMDRWWSRTFNRYRGTLLQAPTRAGLDRIKQLLGKPELSDDEAIAAVVEPHDTYAAKNFKNGTELEKAANTVYKMAFENLEDTPFNATDRTFMLDAVNTAQKMLVRKGYPLSVADIQAILWYYEKRLYGDLGARQSADISYEEAARRVVDALQSGTTPAEDAPHVGEDTYTGGGGTRVVFEVAPDPNDKALADEWRALPPGARNEISQRVAAQVVPNVLQALGATGELAPQIGSYLDDTNPSFALKLGEGSPVDVAKALGFALSQDSMVVLSDKPFGGSSPTGAIAIEVGEKTPAEIDQIYQTLRAIRVGDEQPIGGQSTVGGNMVVLNFSEVPTDELARLIDAALSNSYNVKTREVHSAFPEKQEYDYASPTDDGRGSDPAVREWAGAARSEATRILAAELAAARDAGTLKQSALGQRPGSVSLTGVHFSRQARDVLHGIYYGTGLKGLESDRVLRAADTRLRKRVYFYVDEGKGVRPEAGVGGIAHAAELTNLYDAKADPLKLWRGDVNDIESRLLDAGYSGYYVRDAFNQQGAAVVLGDSARAIPAAPIENPTTKAPPIAEAPKPYVRGLLSREVNALDMAKIAALAPSARIKSGNFIVDREHFPAAQAAAAAQGVNLPSDEPALNQPARGTFNPKTLTTTLLKDADLSTFLHETGHFFLEVLADIAGRADAPVRAREDMETVLQWFGVKDLAAWRGMTLDEQRPFHEKFAESFEQYLFEGKAPSKELQPLFQRFRTFLLGVYRSLKEFVGMHDNKLSDEVRAVFDRMLATDAEINAMQQQMHYQALFEKKPAGMTDEEWAEYINQNAQASVEAVEALQARSLRDVKWTINARSKALKAIAKDVEAKRKAVQAEVTAEVDATPEMQARAYLNEARKQGELSDLDMDVVAERFGFASGDEMLRAIDAYGPRAAAIEGMTDQRLLERYGDLVTPQGMAAAANEAVHNEARARFVASELRALQDGTNKREATGETDRKGRAMTENVLLKAAKNFAANIVARRKVRDLRPGEFTIAERRAAQRALDASKTGNTEEAIAAKQDQLLNFHSAKAVMEAKDEIERKVKRLQQIADSTTLPAEYKDQIDKLLERFDLRPSTTLKEIDKRAALLEWVKSQEEMGIEPDIPTELLNEANQLSYKEMTVEQFRGLYDTVRQIEHLGRLKDKLLTAKDQREFAAIRDEIASSIDAHARGREADTRTPNTVLGEALVGLKKFGAAHIKVATWARVMDGGKDGGPVWEHLIRNANEAGNREVVMREQATRELAALVAPVLAQGKMGGKGVFFPSVGRALNREAVLAIALNTGNASNLQRLLGGEGWTAAQVEPILATLTAADWRFVQSVWDFFEKYRPLIAEKEKRVSGKEPDWIEASPRQITSADGASITLRGGYYPVKYDPRASEKAEAHADAELARQQIKGAYTSATTRRSFTKARAEEVVGRPLLYSLDGIYNGVQEVIHDLSWHEFLIDANRLLRDKKISAAMREKYGPEAHQQFKSWLQDVAQGEQAARNAGERALAWVRQGVSISGLGFNIMSALIQPLGATQSITRIGAKWFGKGLAKYIGSPIDTADEINAKSDFMRTRYLTRLRELAEVRAQVKGRSKTRQAVDGGAYYMMLKAQQMVDVPTWWGAYEKAVAEGNAEDRAVALADQAVIDSQGGGSVKDLSAIERGGPAQKLFTTFYSFFNTTLNLGVQKTMNSESKAKLAADYLMLFVVPVILSTLLKEAMTAGGDDDPEKLARKLIGEEISYLFGLMFGVREIAGAVQVVTGTNPYGQDYSGPAGLRPITDLYKVAQQVHQGEADPALRKALIRMAGDLLRLPSAQINRSIDGAEALADGKTENPLALVTGYQERR